MKTYRDFSEAVASAGYLPINRGGGHWQIKRDATTPAVVSCWPASKRGTAYVTEYMVGMTGVRDIETMLTLAIVAFARFGHDASIGRRIQPNVEDNWKIITCVKEVVSGRMKIEDAVLDVCR